MGVSFKIIRQAAITGGGPDQDFTSSGFGTPKAAIFIVTSGITDATAAAHAVWSVGFTDGSSQVVSGAYAEDNLADTDTYRNGATDEVIQIGDGAGAIDGEANFKEWITDGVRITWGNYLAAAHLVTCILIGGSDVSAKVGTWTQPAGDTNTVNVDVGFEPDQVICIGNGAGFSTDGSTQAQLWVGIADNGASIVQACHAWTSKDAATQGEANGIIKNNRIAINHRTGSASISRAAELTAFITSPVNGFTCTTRDTNDSFTFDCGYLALDYSSAVDHSVEFVDSPTSTGDDAQTGPGFTPQFVLEILTKHDDYATSRDDNRAAIQGISIFTADDEFCNAIADEHDAATTNTQSVSDNKAINLDDDDGTDLYEAAFKSMDANGWTLDFTVEADDTIRKWAALVVEEEAAGGDEYFQSAAGVLTPVGTIVKSGRKVLAGASTLSGVIVKATTKTFTGSATPAGSLIKQAQKILFGSATLSGILSTTKAALLSIGGSLTPSGTLIKRANKIFTGSVTASGAMIRSTAKSLVGSVIATGIIVKKVNKIFSGSVTLSGILAAAKATLLSIGGSLAPVGTLVKKTAKTFVGSVTTAGTIVKQAHKVLLGSVSASGILNATKTALLSIGGALTPVGTLVRQTGKIATGSITSVGALVKQTSKSFAGSLTPVGSLIRKTFKDFTGAVTAIGSLATQKFVGGYYQVVGGVLTMSGVLTKQTSKIFDGSLAPVGVLVKRTAKAFTGSITAIGSLVAIKRMYQVVSGVLSISGIMVRKINKQTAGILTMTGSITKRVSKTFTGVITAIGVLARQLLGLPTPYDQIYAIASENRIYAIASENRIYSVPG